MHIFPKQRDIETEEKTQHNYTYDQTLQGDIWRCGIDHAMLWVIEKERLKWSKKGPAR